MNVKNRQDFLIMLTIAAAALFIGINFVFSPLQGWWSERQAQVRQLTAKIKDGNTLIKREAGYRSRWNEMRANALPANPSQAEHEFLKAVDGWSRGSGVTITSLMPQWKNDSTNYMTLNCRVETSGDLRSLTQFLYDIEKGPMPVRLESVELSSHDNNGQQMTLGIEINGLALLQNDKK